MAAMPRASFALVETCSGTGDLLLGADVLQRVQYRVQRYQGMLEGSGMPIPGLHRIEGTIASDGAGVPPQAVGPDLTLRLEDGREMRVTVTGSDGSILAVGHGPGRGCSCC
jgi:hypothetical protein